MRFAVPLAVLAAALVCTVLTLAGLSSHPALGAPPEPAAHTSKLGDASVQPPALVALSADRSPAPAGVPLSSAGGAALAILGVLLLRSARAIRQNTLV